MKKKEEMYSMNLHDIMLFLLSPLLAVAVYFLLFAFGLNGVNAIYTLSVVSFSVGLVTEEVIQTLTNFTKEKIANKGSSTKSNNNKGQ